jgi:hypothetical protein
MDLASDANALVDKQLRMARVPRGSGVSAEFPWWRTLTETLGINARVYLRRPNWSASGFANASDKRVRITEIRMRGDLARWSENSGLREGLWVRMGTANGQQVVQEWQPWQALQTEMDRFALAELDSYAVKFPAEYFLSRSNLFRLDVRYDADIFDINQFTAGTNEYIVMAGLHGWAPVDGRPFDLMLPIIMWQRDNPAAGDFESWSFDDARERPLRDAWITHFSIGAAKQSNDDRALQGLQFRLHAPDGPKWHEDEWYRIDMLAEQIGSLRAMDDFVIHRPKVPYIIEPGQSFDIEVWNRTGAAVGFEATVQGLQEV